MLNFRIHKFLGTDFRSIIGTHVKDEHGKDPETIGRNFKISEKCQSEMDCLIIKMFFMRVLRPILNKQSF